jgi:tetratricopeptide (TPR) repeat protein
VGGAPEAGKQPAATDWSALADRAARKFADLVDKARPYVDKARPAAEKATEAGRKMAVDLEGGIDEAFGKVSARARDLLSKGQHTRVNIKFRGRTLAELPIAVVAAAEVASLWWFGPLRLLLGHFVGKTVLDVEFVSNADEHVAAGRALLADGDVDDALVEFDRALSMDRRCEGAHLGRGIALKLRGDKPAARAAFERAEELDPHGEVGREARRHLDNLGA